MHTDMHTDKHTVVLESSTHPHTLTGNSNVKVENITDSILKLKIHGDGIVRHGEHGTIKTESENVVKYVQQEYNPVTKAIQNSFD